MSFYLKFTLVDVVRTVLDNSINTNKILKKKTTYNIESGMLFEHGWYLLNMGCCKEGNKVACKPLNDIMGYFSCKKISETTNKTISTVRWLNDDNNRISVEAIKWSINEMFEPMLENLSDKKNLEAFIMIFFFTQIWKNV